MSEKPYEVLIIGGGPAGLSAALALGRVRRRVLVLDSGEYRNALAERMHTVLTRDGEKPSVYRQLGKQEIQDKYKTVEFAEGMKVTEVKKHKFEDGEDKGYQGFEVSAAGDKKWRAKKVLFATGLKDLYPDIPGYAECWAKGIHHCLFCEGFDDADKDMGVLCLNTSPLAVHQAFSLSSNVTVFTNGPTSRSDETILAALQHRGAKIITTPISRFIKELNGSNVTIELTDGNKHTLGFVWHNKVKFELRSKEVIKKLGLEITGLGLVQTERQGFPMMQTNVRGVFAAGDCTEMLQQVTTSVSGGVVAGGMINYQLCLEDEEVDKKAVIATRGKQ